MEQNPTEKGLSISFPYLGLIVPSVEDYPTPNCVLTPISVYLWFEPSSTETLSYLFLDLSSWGL